MVCYNPQIMYPLKELTKNGKQNYTYSKRLGLSNKGYGYGIYVPCNQCLGCRFNHAREFGLRSCHETQYHENNIFITLTYSPKNLPDGGSLVYSHLQDFWKRLRSDIDEHPGRYIQSGDNHISYMACGEYGSCFLRPHFHAVVYNLDFADRRPFYYRETIGGYGYWVYRSQTLEKLWTFGFSSLGEVNFAVSQYVAGYVMKKQCGKDLLEYYGEKVPERVFMSQKPAVGRQWFVDNAQTIMYKGYCMGSNHGKFFKLHVPRYYLKKCQELYPDMYDFYVQHHKPLTTIDTDIELIRGKDRFKNLDSNYLYMQTMNDKIERELEMCTDTDYTLSDNYANSLDNEEL